MCIAIHFNLAFCSEFRWLVICAVKQTDDVLSYTTTDVTRVLKAPGAELCQNACGVVNKQKNILFSSVFSRVLNE